MRQSVWPFGPFVRICSHAGMLLLATVATTGAGPKPYGSLRGTLYRTIWRQEKARGWRPYLAVPTDRNERDPNRRNLLGNEVDIRRSFPGLIGCSGTDLNNGVFPFRNLDGGLIEIVTTGESRVISPSGRTIRSGQPPPTPKSVPSAPFRQTPTSPARADRA